MGSPHNDSNEMLSNRTVEDVIGGYVYAIIAVVGILGNSLVLVAVVTSKALKTSTTVFIVNLAVTDLLTCLTLPWFAFAPFVDETPYWDIVCFVTVVVAHTTIGCSIYTLASIAINRFVLILSPHKYYRRIFRPKVFVIWVSFLWCWTTLIAVFPPAVPNVGISFEVITHICQPIAKDVSSLYDQLFIYIHFPVPLLIIGVSYTGIYVKVFKHKRRINKTVSQSSLDNRMGRASFQREMKITRNMFYIFCAFLVCLLPHFVCSLTPCVKGSFTRMIVSINSAVNPFIYGINHPHFRQVFKDILKLNCRSL